MVLPKKLAQERGPHQALGDPHLAVLRKVFSMAEVWCCRPGGTKPCKHIFQYRAGKSTRLIIEEEMGKLFGQLDQMQAEGLQPYAISLAKLGLVRPDSKTGRMSAPISVEAYRLLSTAPRQQRSSYKKRVARAGIGKSGGYCILLSAPIGARYVFLYEFPESATANITQDEKKALQYASNAFLGLFAEALVKASREAFYRKDILLSVGTRSTVTSILAEYANVVPRSAAALNLVQLG